MIIGAHAIVYSKDPDADRAFLKDVLGFRYVDAGDGWLIFGLPPAEVAVHPSDRNDVHEFYLMCEDVHAFVAQMQERNIYCGPVQDQGWGILTSLSLPGGGRLGVYQPRHARPKAVGAPAPAKRKAAKRRLKKKPAKRITRMVAKKTARKTKAKPR
jgi:catechol 2,3-dioxygenase-like lactoylglutathione lyase family enzyme